MIPYGEKGKKERVYINVKEILYMEGGCEMIHVYQYLGEVR